MQMVLVASCSGTGSEGKSESKGEVFHRWFQWLSEFRFFFVPFWSGVQQHKHAAGVPGAATAHGTAGESKRIRNLLEVIASDSVKHLVGFSAAAEGAAVTRPTAGERTGIIGMREISESDSPLFQSTNSSMGVGMSACARAVCALPASAAAAPRSCTSAALVSPASAAHALVSPLHSNSWSDTGRVKGPTGKRGTKGGVSGPAEDLHPVSEVEAGVNFRPAGSVRRQVVRSLPGRQPGTGTRKVMVRCGHTFPPEVPGTQFVSPGRGLGIRQSMGWTKVCETARSGIWVLKGNARIRMLRANLDHLRVEWRKQGAYETAWVVCVRTSMDMEQQSDHKLLTPSGMRLFVCGAGSRPSCHLGVAGGSVPTGVNLNRYAGIRWHCDNEPLFGSPKV